MTRFPYDEFAKGFFESLLSPFGDVQTSYKISSEVRAVNIYFTPSEQISSATDLGLLSQCVLSAAVIEPLEDLGEALLDFSRMSDLVAWLNVDRSQG